MSPGMHFKVCAQFRVFAVLCLQTSSTFCTLAYTCKNDTCLSSHTRTHTHHTRTHTCTQCHLVLICATTTQVTFLCMCRELSLEVTAVPWVTEARSHVLLQHSHTDYRRGLLGHGKVASSALANVHETKHTKSCWVLITVFSH